MLKTQVLSIVLDSRNEIYDASSFALVIPAKGQFDCLTQSILSDAIEQALRVNGKVLITPNTSILTLLEES